MAAYVGRFAPTPSGPLHFGSLVAALASYLDAKAHHGQWLVRIDDIDEPRSQPGAQDLILAQLQQHGLCWDGDIRIQTEHKAAYQQALTELQQHQHTYACDCTRRQIKARGPHYDGHCRQRQLDQSPSSGHAIRLCNRAPIYHFNDRILGRVDIAPESAREDFVLRRRDGLFTYQLSVVVDDIQQGITDVVRGADLLEPTSWQLQLYGLLGHTPPRFAHIPLALDERGQKLSKQNHAPALQAEHVLPQLHDACQFLGLTFSAQQSVPATLALAIDAWRLKYLSNTS
ncbi:tRNA glutamyl-Q(34) synthetase GluQRS [Pseudidiomarina taiwanensis]|uniref:Glutamyl-Q tRNA(Asp) synthetase n=1 Tax=Pseudidiomarina taiwanensis TaxID=337250 RepID=A0A432ZCB7_9GAMM|nr:tRNA glutamyl-Q(34) synthetase GluQRS [Pseudidiomarina taiwanensis]RUO75576.1 tRNA glutamyl-Q(34) synthetase GluQRS [Pseudidiomarina taiwanensis]